MPWIPATKLGLRDLFMWKDGRFGYEDFTLLPQFLVHKYWHVVCVIREPCDATVPHVLWVTPTLADWQMEEGCALGVLGRLKQSRLDALQEVLAQMCSRVGAFIDKYGNNAHLALSTRELVNCYHRLVCVPSTFRDLLVQVSGFQVVWKDMDAYLRYWTEYHPKLADLQSDGHLKNVEMPPPDMQLMGAICTETLDVQKLAIMGIPVWHYRSDAHLPSGYDLGSRVLATHLPDPPIVEDMYHEDGIPKPFPIIHSGPALPHRLTMMRTSLFRYMDAPDPFLNPPNPLRPDIGNASGPVRSNLSSSSRKQLARPEPMPVQNTFSSRPGICLLLLLCIVNILMDT